MDALSDDLPLHRLFRRRADEAPDRVALLFGEGEVRYGRLREWADRVAGGLSRAGVRPGDRVGLRLERSPEWVAAALGILRVGAAVVPLPPADPAERTRRIVVFGGLKAVIGDGPSDLDVPVLEGSALLAAEPLEGGSPDAEDPDAPAFVLSSSGSTGHPKLIVRSHRSFMHRLRWTWSTYPFGEDDVGCQKAHATTTHSLYELFEPLLAGAPTLIVPDAVTRDLERFWLTVRERGVTRLLIVPSALRASLDMPDFTPPPLRVAVLMGEYVAPDLAVRAVESLPSSTALHSIYGSTEASSTLVVDLREEARPGRELPLGIPIDPSVRALVLDDGGAPVGPGETGRLHMAGPALFSGYLNDPERTAEVLREAPAGGEPLYDTRDRVRRTEDGRLHFLGRVDHTVKVRGFRVDLLEVEGAMLEHPEVTEAAAVVRNEGTARAALLGFYRPPSLDRDALLDWLGDRLPAYGVPSALIGLDELPRTRSGKVDRVRLAAEDLVGAVPDRPTRPWSDTETRVAGAWEATLGHARFGPSSHFFEVGGTSLTAFTLVQRLREAFGLDRDALPGETVYRFPTVESIARHLEGAESGHAPAAVPTPIAVTLRPAGEDAGDRPPLFVVASAGGTLGAYEKLARALETDRAIIGFRDPFLSGDRAPWDGFRAWLDRYEGALLERQPEGPVHLCAYSSAAAFAYELARRLRARGRKVALLALVDPLAMDRGHPRRFGHLALRATWRGLLFRTAVRTLGRLRSPFVRILNAVRPPAAPLDHALAPEAFEAIAEASRRDRAHLMRLATLMELNSGIPFALDDEDFAGIPADRSLEVFLDRVTERAPEIDREVLERIVVQYEDQVRAQHAYRLTPIDVPTLVVEPESPHAGIVAEQLRPFVPRLVTRRLSLGELTERQARIAARLGGLQAHYRSMRDDRFVEALARELEGWL